MIDYDDYDECFITQELQITQLIYINLYDNFMINDGQITPNFTRVAEAAQQSCPNPEKQSPIDFANAELRRDTSIIYIFRARYIYHLYSTYIYIYTFTCI